MDTLTARVNKPCDHNPASSIVPMSLLPHSFSSPHSGTLHTQTTSINQRVSAQKKGETVYNQPNSAKYHEAQTMRRNHFNSPPSTPLPVLGIKPRTQGLAHARQAFCHWAAPPALKKKTLILRQGVAKLFGLTLNSVSQVDRIIGMYQHAWPFFTYSFFFFWICKGSMKIWAKPLRICKTFFFTGKRDSINPSFWVMQRHRGMPQTIKNMIQQFHYSVYSQRKWNQHNKETSALLCLLHSIWNGQKLKIS
jgi:hypothetical protein